MTTITIEGTEVINFLSSLPEEKREPIKKIMTLLAEAKEISEQENFNLIAFTDTKYIDSGYFVVRRATEEMNDSPKPASIIPLIIQAVCNTGLSTQQQLRLLDALENIDTSSNEDSQCDCPVCTAERESNSTMH